MGVMVKELFEKMMEVGKMSDNVMTVVLVF